MGSQGGGDSKAAADEPTLNRGSGSPARLEVAVRIEEAWQGVQRGRDLAGFLQTCHVSVGRLWN